MTNLEHTLRLQHAWARATAHLNATARTWRATGRSRRRVLARPAVVPVGRTQGGMR